jgi:hypothetical protein
MAQAIERLPSKREVLNSNPSTTKKKSSGDEWQQWLYNNGMLSMPLNFMFKSG